MKLRNSNPLSVVRQERERLEQRIADLEAENAALRAERDKLWESIRALSAALQETRMERDALREELTEARGVLEWVRYPDRVHAEDEYHMSLEQQRANA